jgi:hypothetical protein
VPDERPASPGSALTRSALERVLARAAELQASVGDEDAGALTEEQLIELGKDVGLSGEHLRQALAEERSRPLLPRQAGWLGTITGVSAVTAARTVSGTSAAVLATLDAWMQGGETLRVKRRFTDQLVWESRSDVFATIRRALRIGGRGYDLTPANDVSAIVAPVGADRVHVRIVADFSATQGQRAAAAGVASAVMLMAGVPLVVIGVAAALAAIPPLLGASAVIYVTRRQYRRLLARAQVALEQALDRLEFGEARPATGTQVLLEKLTALPRLPR